MIALKILMVLAAVAFIGYPLLRQWTEEEEVELPQELEELHRRKESTYSALKELEFDFRTGKLSETDYRELDTKYRADAVEILEAIEEEEAFQRSGRAMGRKATPARAAKPAATRKKVAPAAGGRTRSAQAAVDEQLVCLACDHVNPHSARFCGGCGDALLEQTAVAAAAVSPNGAGEPECADCGAPVEAGHRFCGSCGAEVHA